MNNLLGDYEFLYDIFPYVTYVDGEAVSAYIQEFSVGCIDWAWVAGVILFGVMLYFFIRALIVVLGR